MSDAESAIPHGASWALASEGVDIPFFATCAGVDFEAGVTIPSGANRAVTEFGLGVVDSAECAVEADRPSPAGSNWALALVVQNIEGLSSWAQLNAATSIPVVTITATDAGLLDSGVGASRTGLDTDSVADELVARTTAALGADEEQVLEGEVLGEFLTKAKVEDELGACPGCAEGDVLVVMVDDEASETMNTSVVAADVVGRRVGDFIDSVGWLVGEVAGNQTQLGGNPGHITDVDGVNLSDCRGSDEHDDS